MIRLWALAIVTCLLLSLLVPWYAAWSLLIPLAVVTRSARDRGPRLYPQAMRDELVRQQGVRCYVCNTPTHSNTECPDGGDCPDCREFDHWKSWKNGGRTTLRNGRVLCQWCNGRKGAGTPAELRANVLAEWRSTRRG